ncbi:MAG: D-glycero-alpha-D-manno-heptose-1,7-bisphosphate 7-phosphatase [Actinomycetota bacterium]
MPRGDAKIPAVFLDRDGVLCQNRADYVKSWSEFSFIPGSVEAIASLTLARVRVFIVTNQSAVGRGLLSRRDLDRMHERMMDVLRGAGGKVEAVLVCPHHPDDGCACRKPESGLLLDAAERFNVDLARSFLSGDAGSDMIAGKKAGCSTVLVKTGLGAETIRDKTWGKMKPDFIADDLVDASMWVLGQIALGLDMRTEARR